MRRVEYIEGNDWSVSRLVYEDEYGNRGTVRFPRRRERGFGLMHVSDQWEDAEVDMQSRCEGTADETAAAAEFFLTLAHVAKTLDLAFAEDRAEALAEAEEVAIEREHRKKIRDAALQRRCEDVAQFYMQMVRIQRDGYSSKASGELHVVVQREGHEDQAIRRQMFLRERNGNRWDFNADQIATFEVKDGSRYEQVTLTSMEDLEAEVSKELVA